MSVNLIPVEFSKGTAAGLAKTIAQECFNENAIREAIAASAKNGASGYVVTFCDESANYVILRWSVSSKDGSHFQPAHGRKRNGYVKKNVGGYVSIGFSVRSALESKWKPSTRGFSAALRARIKLIFEQAKGNAAAAKKNTDAQGYALGLPPSLVSTSDLEWSTGKD